MKKNLFTVYAAVVALFCLSNLFVSCENSTMLGLDEIENIIPGEEGVTFKLENVALDAEFSVDTCKFFTEFEVLSLEEAAYMQGEEVSRDSYEKHLDVHVPFSIDKPLVKVSSKEALTKVGMVSMNTEQADTTSHTDEENFVYTTEHFNYKLKFDQGEVITAQGLHQNLAYRDTSFSCVNVKGVSFASFKSVRNKELSKGDTLVNDITYVFNVETCCDINMYCQIYPVEVYAQRMYVPEKTDNYTRVESQEYVANFAVDTALLYTVEQSNSFDFVTYTNGNETNRVSFTKGLDLNVNFTVVPSTVELKKETAVALSSSSRGELKSTDSTDTNGFDFTNYSQNYEFGFNEGEVITAEANYQEMSYDGEEFGYGAITSVTFKNSATRTISSTSTLKVVEVTLYFDVTVTYNNVERKAETFTVPVVYQRNIKIEEPVPGDEDKFVSRSWRNQLREVINATTEKISWTEVEVWTVSGEKTTNKSFELYRHFNAPALQLVVTDNTGYNTKANGSKELRESSETNGNLVVTTRYMEYSSTADNGSNAFNNVYSYDQQKAVYTDPDGHYTLTFDYADWTITEGTSEVSSTSTEEEIDGSRYDVYDYVNNINTVYFETYEADAKAEARIAIQKPDVIETFVENKAYESEFNTRDAELYTVRQLNSADVVTYTNGEETARESWEKNIDLNAMFTIPETVYVNSEEALENVKLTKSSHDVSKYNNVVDGNFTVKASSKDYNFGFNEGETVKSATKFESLTYGNESFEYGSIDKVSYDRAEVSENAESTPNRRVVDVTLYFNVEVAHNNPNSSAARTMSVSGTSTEVVTVTYQRVYEVKDELIDVTYRDLTREVIDDNTEKVSWTEVENWTVSGEKTFEKVFNLYRHFNAPKEQWVYTANNSYNTTSNGSVEVETKTTNQGNWSVTTRYMEYTSTADNGDKAFNNVYTYDYQKAVYTDPDGYYTINVDYAEWTISEVNSAVSSTSTEMEKNGLIYNVYDYVNNINTVYSIDSYEANAQATAKIAVEKEIEKFIPEEWGNIIGAGISAVPADQVNGSYAQKCLTIRTDKGAVAIPFSMDATMPEESAILGGYFVEGNFGEEYNSGYYTTNVNKGNYPVNTWAPAIAKDLSDRIAYYNGETCVRNIRNTTLSMWGWRGGNNSTVVNGYEFSVSGDVLTIKCDGKIVKQLR